MIGTQRPNPPWGAASTARLSSEEALPVCLKAVVALLTVTACGGYSPPSELRVARVEVGAELLRKELLKRDARLPLVFGFTKTSTQGELGVVGFGNACVISLTGAIKNCGSGPEELGLAVPVQSIGSFLDDGALVADLDGDGKDDRLVSHADGFEIQATGTTRSILLLPGRDYWFKPAVTWSEPHRVLISTDELLLVFGPQPNPLLRLPTPGMTAPLHIVAGAPLGDLGSSPFASAFEGRGGWHRTILFVHSSRGHVIYKEVLEDDFPAIWPVAGSTCGEFLLGGRGEIWKYSLKCGKNASFGAARGSPGLAAERDIVRPH
jgi:hypothetical protein